MHKPRINLMVMTEAEPDRPVRSYSLPGNAPRLAIYIGISLAVVFLATVILAIYFGTVAGRVRGLEADNDSLRRSVEKITVLETELAYHRDFTRRVAELLGIDVPNFSDSAAQTVAAAYAGDDGSDSAARAGVDPRVVAGGVIAGAPGILVTDCPPDPNNRPRGMPLVSRISRGFAPHEDNPSLHHLGIDLAVREGVPVLATADGTVTFAGADDLYGLYIVIDHHNGFKSAYGHNSVILVREGETVQRGDRIGFSGNTGVSTAPHLHYQIEKDGEPVDPRGFLGR